MPEKRPSHEGEPDINASYLWAPRLQIWGKVRGALCGWEPRIAGALALWWWKDLGALCGWRGRIE
jgi:hypothetical protein